MNLYLVQHGKATDEQEDPQRPLSENGRRELCTITAFLETGRKVSAETVFHSGKLRSEQTAVILAKVIKPTGGVEKTGGLAPMDDPSIWADKLAGFYQNIMLVGHLPHLNRLASLLLTGDPLRETIHFHNAGVICLFRDPDRRWAVDWIVIPSLLP